MSFAIFDERTYLNNYPDVRAAVASGAFVSGLEHFQKNGRQEGRVLVSPLWNEQVYLQANPDVANAVRGGVISSGLQHFILFGESEGRPGAPVIVRDAGFNEDYYLSLYPDVSAAVARGQYNSAESHYTRSGHLEGRLAVFTGTRGDDVVTGTGLFSGLVGVAVDVIASRGAPDLTPISLGVGEVDVLTGGPGQDSFLLGLGRSPANPTPQRFYVGGGNADFAYIKDFNRNIDSIQLAGNPSDYGISPGSINVGGTNTSTVSIFSLATNDIVAVVEGVNALQLLNQDTNQGIFFLG